VVIDIYAISMSAPSILLVTWLYVE